MKSKWSQWVNLVRPIAECRAYDVSVPCFNKLLKQKACDRPTLTPDEHECCGEIQLNLKDDMDGQQIYKCDRHVPADTALSVRNQQPATNVRR